MFSQLQMLLIEIIYFLLIFCCCGIIFYKVRSLYSFSKYKGLKYFGNAFLFLAIGFLIRFIVMLLKVLQDNNITGTISDFNIFTIGTVFTMVLPGFFFLYSLLWKSFEKKKYGSSFFAQIPIYIAALIIALIDYTFKTLNTMYITQISLFFIISIIIYLKLRTRKYKKNRFMWFFFVSMILLLVIWIINFIAQYTINTAPLMRIHTYILTIITCFVMLYLVTNLMNGIDNKNYGS